MFLVPEVEEPRDWCPDHNKVTVQVLSVKVNILTAPAFHFQVKTPYWKQYQNTLFWYTDEL